MLKIIAACLMSMAAQCVLAQDSAIADETPTADQANDRVEVAEDAEFNPPPGFLTKKRGELVVYCKKDRETGTRFVTEKCLDEAQMREYLLSLAEQKRNIDRIRSTCATSAVCANP